MLADEVRNRIDKIDGIESSLAENTKHVYIDSQPRFLDLHYDILKGVGWVEDPSPSTTSYISISATSGAKSLNVVDGTPYREGQLIVIRDFNNDYYSINKITTIAGNVLNLEFPLERAFGNGNRVYKFYVNYAHPTIEGYNAIADYVMTKILGSDNQSVYQLPSSMFTGGNVTDGVYADYKTPDETFKSVTLNQNEKYLCDINLEGGTYDLAVIANLKNATNVRLEISRASDNLQVFGQKLISSDTVSSQSLKVNLSSGKYKVYFANVDAAQITILFKALVISKIINSNALKKLDRKKHIFLGDSWFADGTIVNRMRKYLPNAELLNYGVGGNKMDNLIRRYNGSATDTDRTSTLSDADWNIRKNASTILDADFVWIMCGTNDYFANKTAQTFHFELNSLLAEITKRGCKPIVFHPSVGDIGKGNNAVAHDILKLSRQYVSFNFQEYSFFNKKLEEVFTTIIPISHDIAQGTKTMASIYIKDRIVEIEQVTFNNGAGKSIDIGFGDINIQSTALSNVVNFTQNITTKAPIVTKDSRFLNIVLKNDNAANATFIGSVWLKIKPLNY